MKKIKKSLSELIFWKNFDGNWSCFLETCFKFWVYLFLDSKNLILLTVVFFKLFGYWVFFNSYFGFNNFGPVLLILFYYYRSPLFLWTFTTHMPQRRRQPPISKARVAGALRKNKLHKMHRYISFIQINLQLKICHK